MQSMTAVSGNETWNKDIFFFSKLQLSIHFQENHFVTDPKIKKIVSLGGTMSDNVSGYPKFAVGTHFCASKNRDKGKFPEGQATVGSAVGSRC